MLAWVQLVDVCKVTRAMRIYPCNKKLNLIEFSTGQQYSPSAESWTESTTYYGDSFIPHLTLTDFIKSLDKVDIKKMD